MKQDEKILAQYYDGELSGARKAKAKALIDSSSESADALRNMEAMSRLFQVMKEETLENVSFDGLDKRVLNEIQQSEQSVPFGEKIRVWFKEFFAHRKAVWVPVASIAGAACAALLAIGLQSSANPMAPNMPNQNAPQTWNASGTTPAVASTVNVTAPENIDVQKYSLQTEGGQRIAVVWINE